MEETQNVSREVKTDTMSSKKWEKKALFAKSPCQT